MNAAPAVQRSPRKHNFDWVTEDLAVGGGFARSAVESLARDHAVGAVVDLREEDRDDESLLLSHGMVFLHLPTPDVCAVSDNHLEDGVAFARAVRAEGRRLLIHCMHGIGRSATLALCVLADRGVAPLEALKDLKRARALISPSPAQFECWADWLRRRGIDPPHFEDFAKIAYAQDPWAS